MKTFNADALRRAIGGADADAANDLVRRTLSQHGLLPGGLPAGGLAGLPDMPAMSQLLAKHVGASAAPAALVPGASFDGDRFTCDAGSRDYLTYVPASAEDGAAGLIMMLHGCTQTHADFAIGTGMNDLAERHRLVIVYPQQSRGDNAQSCWNWFNPGDQRRGRGEPAILAGMAEHVARKHRVPSSCIFVAGLSAGAAMAVILGQTHGDVFAAVGAHSGLPYGAARDVASAFAAMAGQGYDDGAAPRDGALVPTIVFHGLADRTVHPMNGDRIARSVIASAPDQTIVQQSSGTDGGRAFTQEVTQTTDGNPMLERWTIDGLGHAWSGGKPGGSHTDPNGPDASAEMVRFFLQQPAGGA